MMVKWGVEERNESLEELQTDTRKRVTLSRTIDILLLVIAVGIFVSSTFGYLGKETGRSGRLYIIIILAIIPGIQFVYKWASTKILWKEYLDSPTHIEPVGLYDIQSFCVIELNT